MKRLVTRTNMGEDFLAQATTHERTDAQLRHIASRANRGNRTDQVDDEGALPYTDPNERYHIALSQKDSYDLEEWLEEHKDDPAYEVGAPLPNFHFKIIDYRLWF